MQTITALCKQITSTINNNSILQNVTTTCLVKKISMYPYMIYLDIVDCDNHSIAINATIDVKLYKTNINVNDKIIISGKIDFYKNIVFRIKTYLHDVPLESIYDTIYSQLCNDSIMQIPKKKISKIRNIAILSSSNAAGLKDFLDVIAKTNINHVYIFPITLQGPYMEKSTLNAIKNAQKYDIDALILIRGGGSRTDLEWFDNYNIAVAIKTCPIITICGIGHEIDHSIIDDVTDYSFNTPTQVSYFIRDILLNSQKKLSYVNSVYSNNINEMSKNLIRINNTIKHYSTILREQYEHKINKIMDKYVFYTQKITNIINNKHFDHFLNIIDNVLDKLKHYKLEVNMFGQSCLQQINSKTIILIKDSNDNDITSKKDYQMAIKKGLQIKIQFIDGYIIL